MVCAVWVVSAFLVSSAVPGTPVHHSRHVAEHKQASPEAAALPVTIYGDAVNAAPPESSAVVTVLGEDRRPGDAGRPETVYGDVEPQHVYEVAASDRREIALPVTAYAGEAEIATEGMPETVYAGGWHPGPVHEAQLAAEEITGEGMAGMEDAGPAEEQADEEQGAEESDAAPACNVPPENGLPLFRNGPGLPMETASPYSSYTDAQRAGMNPCEDKQPGPSPYGELTDAQRAAQTNCR